MLNILLVETDQRLAQLIVAAAQRSFTGAVWEVVPTVAAAIERVYLEKYYRLVLVDSSAAGLGPLQPELALLMGQVQLTYTPVLLLLNGQDWASTQSRYEMGFSACHPKPNSLADWEDLLVQIHRYWFTVNIVPVRPPARR